jgi:hypothetical protein
MTSDVLHDIFINFEARVANEVRKKILYSDFYSRSVTRKPWMAGQGRTFTYPTFERAGLSGSFLPFSPIAAYGTGTTCDIPTVEANNFSATIRSVTLYQAATNTQDICLRDLEFDYQIEQQLSISVQNMAEATRLNWEQELANRYIDLSGNKLIYTADVPTTHGNSLTNPSDPNKGWGATAPAYPLDWSVLDYVYEQLRYIVTPEDVAGIDEEGKAVLTAVGEYEAFNGLKLQDENFRADLRFMNAANEGPQVLVGSPGLPAGRSFRGYKFETVQFAPRYDLVGGTWVQRYPYKLEQKTNGNGLEVDPLYKDANYTDVVIFSKSVFDHLVPAPKNLPNGYEYSLDRDWTGEHRWRKVSIDKESNPDGFKGWWRSVYAYGPQLQRPDLGFVIRVQRCKKTFGEITCGVPGSA